MSEIQRPDVAIEFLRAFGVRGVTVPQMLDGVIPTMIVGPDAPLPYHAGFRLGLGQSDIGGNGVNAGRIAINNATATGTPGACTFLVTQICISGIGTVSPGEIIVRLNGATQSGTQRALGQIDVQGLGSQLSGFISSDNSGSATGTFFILRHFFFQSALDRIIIETPFLVLPGMSLSVGTVSAQLGTQGFSCEFYVRQYDWER